MENWTIWFTGLSGSGKTTLSTMFFNSLKEKNNVRHIDGDSYRDLFFYKLGYTEIERMINMNSMAILANELNKVGVNVILSSIAPYASMRNYCKYLIEKNAKFINIFCDCNYTTRKERDKKSLYNSVISELDKYDKELSTNITVDTEKNNINECIYLIKHKILEYNFFREEQFILWEEHI